MHSKRSDRDDSTGDRDLDAELVRLFERYDELFYADKFSEVDAELASIQVRSVSTAMLIGYLTATLPAKSKLPNRAAFYSKVSDELAVRGETDPRLLSGLS